MGRKDWHPSENCEICLGATCRPNQEHLPQDARDEERQPQGHPDRGQFRAPRPCPCEQGVAVRGGAESLEPDQADSAADRVHHLRDGLRAVGLAAYRHLRRGRPHHHGAPCLPRAHRGQGADAADLFLRRHGRPAQSAGQHPQQGDGDGASRQAADASAGPVRRVSELRPAQQRAAQGLPRYVRLRLRVSVRDRVLHVRTVRRDASESARALRRDPRRDPADARAGTPRHLQSVPADLAGDRQGAASSRHRPRSRLGLGRLQGSGHRQAHAGSRHARPLQAAMEGGLGHALGGARRRL